MFGKIVRNVVYVQLRNRSTICDSVPKLEEFSHSSVINNDTNLLKVAIIGLPNAGKSTFINNLMDRRVNMFFYISISKNNFDYC